MEQDQLIVIVMSHSPAVLGWLVAGKRQKMDKKTRYDMKNMGFYNKHVEINILQSNIMKECCTVSF